MNAVTRYFTGEKFQCSIGIILVLLSSGIALYFLFAVKKPFYNGMAYPFLFVSFFFAIICVGVIIRSPNDIARVEAMVKGDRTKIQTEEIPRMEKVLNAFAMIKRSEIIAGIIGALLFIFLPGTSVWSGVGLGILIQSGMLYVFDTVAEGRGKEYWEFLQTLR